MRALLALFLLALPASAAPSLREAFLRAELDGCLPSADATGRVSLVVFADGAWAIAADEFSIDDAPPESLVACFTEAVRASIGKLEVPRREVVLVRRVPTPDPGAELRERLELRQEAINACVGKRLPASVFEATARLKLQRSEQGVSVTSLEVGAQRAVIASCVRASLGSFLPGSVTIEETVRFERIAGLPAHDGTEGAVCRWADPAGKPRAAACRAQLRCGVCSGGTQRAGEQPEPDAQCIRGACPAVP